MKSTTTLRDKNGKWVWVGKMTIDKPNPIHGLPDLVKEFQEFCEREKTKYNKFSEFVAGVPVFPDFPFRVKLAVGFSPIGPRPQDIYDIDPQPDPWFLHIVEDPSYESVLEKTSFDISQLRHVTEVPIEGWDNGVKRYTTYKEARDNLLKVASYIFKTQMEHYESGVPNSRYAQCPSCRAIYSWSGKSVRGFEIAEFSIKLHPLRKVDEVLAHENCKAKVKE